MLENQRLILNKLSERYNQKRSLPSGFWESFFDYTDNLIDHNSNWLDLGCGSGRILIPIAEKYPQNAFWGVDVSRQMLNNTKEIAQHKNIKNVLFIEADSNYLPFNNNNFDIVCLFQSVHYINLNAVFSRISTQTIKYLIIASTTHEQLFELPYCSYEKVFNFEIQRTPSTDQLIQMVKKYSFELIFQKDYKVYIPYKDELNIREHLKLLPYSALCMLSEFELEEAINEALKNVTVNNHKFLSDAFRLYIFAKDKQKSNNKFGLQGCNSS